MATIGAGTDRKLPWQRARQDTTTEVALPADRWSGPRRYIGFAEHGMQLATDAARPVSLPAMRVLMGVLFVWFGALKVVGLSPVAKLVAGTLPWVDPQVVVPVLGAVEVVLGLGLITGVALRLVLPILVAHLAGTFLTFVMLPELMFRHHDPLLLTADGEFVAKNLVLISATIVLVTHASASGLRRNKRMVLGYKL